MERHGLPCYNIFMVKRGGKEDAHEVQRVSTAEP
nr:MAG TPA: hypothetical protein [Caudoviricetes sp.]